MYYFNYNFRGRGVTFDDNGSPVISSLVRPLSVPAVICRCHGNSSDLPNLCLLLSVVFIVRVQSLVKWRGGRSRSTCTAPQGNRPTTDLSAPVNTDQGLREPVGRVTAHHGSTANRTILIETARGNNYHYFHIFANRLLNESVCSSWIYIYICICICIYIYVYVYIYIYIHSLNPKIIPCTFHGSGVILGFQIFRVTFFITRMHHGYF